MNYKSINPFNGEVNLEIDCWNSDEIENALQRSYQVRNSWQKTPLDKRCKLLKQAANALRDQKEVLAKMMASEMGKLIDEAKAEVEKCAWVCEFYALNAKGFLADRMIQSDASKSFITYQPIGCVLAIMPWNFPLWQVFRFAAPALAAGNVGLLKHAENVPESALAIEKVFHDAGFPDGTFISMMISREDTAKVIADSRVQAVTLTGSEIAGSKVAATAGANLKKTVLELGGSDAFIVLDDCDVDQAVKVGVASRFLNGGQSCIAAKRFIVLDSIADQFIPKFKEAVENLKIGDPLNNSTNLPPMARQDLRNELHQQVQDSISQGAIPLCGCEIDQNTHAGYPASIIDHVKPGMRAYQEELFGPVAIIIRAKDEDDAVRIANDSPYGLGGSVWTENPYRGEDIARQIQSGASFVNGIVKSDPRLPFGGIKNSGYGRELSEIGMHEFVNIKTIWIK